MEFVIQKTDLVRELQTVTGVVEKRATLPILANLLLETRDSGLQVGASDLEVTIRGQARATVSREGSVTLPAGKLHEIARSLPEAEVQFKLLERNQVAISCERTRYKISGQPREEFPSFPELDESRGIRIPARVLREMIDRVAFAITTEDPRYSLNGALFLLREGRLTLVATDSHRLALVSRKIDDAPKDEIRVIVPRKALIEVSKMSADAGEDERVVFGKSDNHVFFVFGRHKLTSNLLEGNFPRYENVIPETCATSVVLPTADLTHAVRRISLLASERFGRAVRLSFSTGKLELFSKTELGEGQETLAVDYTGDEITIGYNARYLLDFLNVVDSPSVRLELNPRKPGETAAEQKVQAGDKPGLLLPEPQGDLEYRYVVMPMHL